MAEVNGATKSLDEIRRELREFDLQTSTCPVDRRRYEREVEERQKQARDEQPVRAADARLAVIERRLAVIAESGEQRVLILRDAIADFAAAELAKRDEEIVSLKKQLAGFQQKLEQQAAIDQRVHEISTRLEERQARRDRDKNGIADGDFI